MKVFVQYEIGENDFGDEYKILTGVFLREETVKASTDFMNKSAKEDEQDYSYFYEAHEVIE
jgi:hypothetical protein